MKRFAGLSLGAALSMAALVPAPGQAASFGGVAASGDGLLAPLVQVQAGPHVRTRAGVPRSSGRVYRGRRNGGIAAGALIGAAILGGAIIANSQRNRGYYYDDGYYYSEPTPVYTPPRQHYAPYYGQPGYVINTPEAPIPQQYVPAPYYHGGGVVVHPGYPRHRTRGMRDPAGGGTLK